MTTFHVQVSGDGDSSQPPHCPDLDYVNEHRAALGHPTFETLTPDELRYHLSLIDKHAQYGEDPWGLVDNPPR